MGFLKPEPSLTELEEKSELLEAKNRVAAQEFSLVEKRAMSAKLKKEYGLTPKHFGADFSKILKWLKEH
jgi:hypothetical protein